jgi:hypothetical protein
MALAVGGGSALLLLLCTIAITLVLIARKLAPGRGAGPAGHEMSAPPPLLNAARPAAAPLRSTDVVATTRSRAGGRMPLVSDDGAAASGAMLFEEISRAQEAPEWLREAEESLAAGRDERS